MKLADQTGVVLHEAELIRVVKVQRHLVEITQDAPVTDFKDYQTVQDWLNDDDAD
ncbi:hypothetical protein DY78_GL001665 [Lactiplantibacillus fabifermentans DSM 21115]|uniref:Uncharacterized protein n=1 Tax=Lactiplantibacillus fabifermentans DSM 21115 TaxID=1413187 RepID=A0A0R2NE22_9LACO|nr:hypothetical protein DY78_GL001665 [Lactiplantibacillus fabifermentans DSM 21115]